MFTFIALSFCALLAGLLALVTVGVRQCPDLWRRLPRERWLGTFLAMLCLAWAAWHAVPMLEGGLARFRIVVVALVPIITVLSFGKLNYLFARALGGLCLLLLTYMLHLAFTIQLPARVVFAAGCYLLLVVAMWQVAAPWYFRDALRKAAATPRWRGRLAGVIGAFLVFFLVFALLPLLG